MYPRFSCLVPMVYLLSQVVSCVSVFLCYLFLNVPSVFLFGPYGLLTFTGCVLCVRVSGLSAGKPRVHSRTDNPETPTRKTQPAKVSKQKGPNRKTEGTFKNR
jgi:hypothetical protein